VKGYSRPSVRIRVLPKLDADVIVAGAGPAGSGVGLALARAGLRVILLDRERFPRDKVCGDFVGPAAVEMLKGLGLTDQPEYRTSNVIKEAALFLDGQHLLTSALPRVPELEPFGRTMRRIAFDDMIFQGACKAGVMALQEHALLDYKVESDLVRVSVKSAGALSSLTARLLIGADGSNSKVAAILRGSRPVRADRIVAVRAYYQGVAGPADRADLYFTGRSFPGYYWLFPTSETTANVGVGMVLDTLPATNEHLRDTLLHLVKTDPALRRRLGGAQLEGKIVGWPLSTYNSRVSITDDRVLLIGDAAGLINPLNGEGIQYALQSARWASETALAALRNGDLSAAGLKPYARRVSDELTYDMALARLLVRAISNRTFNPLWLRALRAITSRARRDPAYGWITGAVLAGLAPARLVLSPRVVYGTVEESVVSLLRESLFVLVGGRPRLRDRARRSAEAMVGIAYENLRHPVASAKWATQLGFAGAELLAEAAKEVLFRRRGHRSRSTM